MGFSQEKTIKKHVVDSQSIEGVWQMAGELKMGDKMSYIPMRTLKVYHSDGTFFVIQITKSDLALITLYGNYELDDEGKMTEYIFRFHIWSPRYKHQVRIEIRA
ncbi:hypothetical protein CAPN007_17930 [Capnocytophaga canimorsus]|nr:hypothetical protein CAPN007_17930 [Capnocytophaga canimorsus]